MYLEMWQRWKKIGSQDRIWKPDQREEEPEEDQGKLK